MRQPSTDAPDLIALLAGTPTALDVSKGFLPFEARGSVIEEPGSRPETPGVPAARAAQPQCIADPLHGTLPRHGSSLLRETTALSHLPPRMHHAT